MFYIIIILSHSRILTPRTFNEFMCLFLKPKSCQSVFKFLLPRGSSLGETMSSGLIFIIVPSFMNKKKPMD